MAARLTLYPPDRPARQLLLDPALAYVIGRDADCDVPLHDASLSRRHARLEPGPSGWELIDLCSKNGTLVNGRQVARCALTPGLWFEAGDVLGCFDEVSDELVEEAARQVTERWATSVHLSRALRPDATLDSLLQQVVTSCVEVAGAERGFIVLGAEAEALASEPAEVVGDRAFDGSRTVVGRALAERRAVVCSDVRGDTLLVDRPSIVTGGISACICLPLYAARQMQGLIYVDSREPGKQFTELDLEILDALAQHASMVIGVSRLRDDIVDLSAMLPAEIDPDNPVDEALLKSLDELLPQLERVPASRVAVAGTGR